MVDSSEHNYCPIFATNNLKYEIKVNSYLKCTHKILRLITQSEFKALSKGAIVYYENHTKTLFIKCRLHEPYSI